MKSKRSRYVQLLLKRFLIIETIALLIIMVVYFSITIPWAVNSALSTSQSTATTITKLLDNTMTDAVNITTNLGNDSKFGDMLKTYAQDQLPQQHAALELQLNNTAYTSNARAIIAEISGLLPVTSITSLYPEDDEFLNTPTYQRVLSRESQSTFSEIYSFGESQYGDIPAPVGAIAYAKNFSRNNIQYTITTFYDIADTLDMINAIYHTSFSDYAILNTNNTIIYSTNDTYGDMARQFIQNYPGNQVNRYEGKGFFTVDFLDVRSWKFVGYISLPSILQTVLADQLLSFIIVIATFFLAFYAFIAPNLSHTLRPVSNLTNAMAAFGAGNLQVQAVKTRDDEIGRMIDVFNSMTKQIITYIEEIKAYQKAQEKSQYGFLISQIDPHFICNTMNMVNALIRKKQYPNAIELNKALIEIVRDRLRIRTTDVLDTVAQEISVVKQYLKVTQYMYDDQVSIDWNIDARLYNALIPKNVMQPIVENALLHGLMDQKTGTIRGKISVNIFEQDYCCTIVISDNGNGMPENEVARMNAPEINIIHSDKGKHIALRNIKSRLHYLSSDQNCMFITSVSGKGTTVKFVFQLIMDEPTLDLHS